MSGSELRILPLGGLGEIGMNCLVLEWDGELCLIDCGVQFPDASYAGVDILVPDFQYVLSRLERLRGIIVTHGHDDHIGAIPFMARHADLDVYSTPFPRGLIQQRLQETVGAREVTFHEVAPHKPFRVGPFTFEPIPVRHSIIESLAYAITTPAGVIVHTGDFKHDANEIGGETFGMEAFEALGRKGVTLLLSDSTNAERVGHTLSETDIARSFEGIFATQSGRLFIALFASNIRRIENLLRLAHLFGKKVAFAGRSMHSYTRLAHEQGSIRLPPDTLVLLEDTRNYPDAQVLVLLTGSQAEPRSVLTRVAEGIHKDIELRRGDKVLMSSRFIPGNERAITRMIDHLYRQGAEVIYESISQIHVSGHGFQDELLMMLRAVRPKYFIPIHGEYRHLAKHAALARETGVAPENVFIVENGQSVSLEGQSMRVTERLDLQKGVVVDGFLMQGPSTLFTHRLNLAKTGIVFVALVRDKRTRELLGAPRVHSYGLMLRGGKDAVEVLNGASDMLAEVYPEVRGKADLEDILRLEVRRFIRKHASHKPVVVPVILDV